MLALDDAGIADQLLEEKDPSLDEALLVLGIVVFGVLVDVAEFLGLPDALGDLGPALVAQDLQLRLEPVQPFLGEVDNLVVIHSSPFSESLSGSQSRRIIRDSRREFATPEFESKAAANSRAPGPPHPSVGRS